MTRWRLKSNETTEDGTSQTKWLRKNNLIRPGVYIPRESWQRFEMALQVENYRRAEDGKPPISRTDVIQAFIDKWSEKRLDPGRLI